MDDHNFKQSNLSSVCLNLYEKPNSIQEMGLTSEKS